MVTRKGGWEEEEGGHTAESGGGGGAGGGPVVEPFYPRQLLVFWLTPRRCGKWGKSAF